MKDDSAYYGDIENKNGEGILESHFMDSNWYYIDTDEEDGIGGDVW